MRELIPYVISLISWLPYTLNAQRVIYSEPVRYRSTVRLQVIGKSENYYWIEKLQKQKSKSRTVPFETESLSFALFDSKLSLLNEFPATNYAGTIKQWLLAGEKSLDQISLAVSAGKTKIICSRFRPEGNLDAQTWTVDSLPFSTGASRFLLVRSADQSKILLVVFENTESEYTRMHAVLFDSDWHIIYHQIIPHTLFTQPCIQDDEIGFPAESFDNLPIKLADNGEWVMASPSRISQNFSLFHAGVYGYDYNFREIPISPYYKMEDVAMSIDNDQQEMSVGLLCGFRNTTLKNVQVFNYSMKLEKFDFDSSFHFNTQARDIGNKNLCHESFIAVPGGGYMFLKEYGSPFEFSHPDIQIFDNWETAYLLADYSGANTGNTKINSGYTLNHGLNPIPFIRNRGDLNFFYFPGFSKDSTWSGILDIEQHTESNNPDLSYLLMPEKNKLYIIYNSQDDFSDPLATTTTLNKRGQATEDALVFWKMNKMLNFQQSHRFSAGQVAVPYMNNQQTGFAIIRLQ